MLKSLCCGFFNNIVAPSGRGDMGGPAVYFPIKMRKETKSPIERVKKDTVEKVSLIDHYVGPASTLTHYVSYYRREVCPKRRFENAKHDFHRRMAEFNSLKMSK